MTWLAGIRIVAITDRRLMVPAELLRGGDWDAIAAAFAASIERAIGALPRDAIAVQLREKDLDGGPLLRLARAARAVSPRLFVNDRLDVALAARADGVHLPEHGLAIADARRLAPELTIGCSRHAAQDEAADLIQLGPIWDTPGKGPPLGPLALALPTRAHLVAVGGIDSPKRATTARTAGADAIAVIRAAWTGDLAALL